MSPAGKRGGRGGRGDGGGGGRSGGGDVPGAAEPRRAGAGRGIPDFKENPGARKGDGGRSGPQGGNDENGNQLPPGERKFKADDAAAWMAARYQAVYEEYEKQKASGKKGDIVNFSDLSSERSAWGSSKPVIPPKDDFLFQLQVALAPYRGKGEENAKGQS
eukprot:gnl/TRDRNA2_/TRDRNA2_46728_c0_seq1.p1 gnl/TRDRNA2_/TRDRNA2_46728_c0~~gnl/TRDRNA2_/TRDRNA2_46728_c0_seq1.p1  ORF type:complete len:161 (-),score=41.37 gnl/TRDRNA2_/TRDRNA2_46728_c0_seq1:101-583(-)